MWETMNISFLVLGILVLSGGSAATATDNSEDCHDAKRLDDLCGTHTFQSVKPILNYVDQLQKEQLSHNEEKKEINELREKVQQLQLKIAEGKFKDDLIDSLKSKDTHIKDLQTTISVLQNTNSVLQQNVESVNAEIAKLKSFIKEELTKEISNINSNASKLRYCEDQLQKNNIRISEYAAQMEMKETSLNMCQLSLNEAQSVVHEYKDQLENANKTIAENTVKISQIEAQVVSKEEALKETQAKLKENQDELKKEKEVIQQKEEKETKLKEQIRKLKEISISCTSFGDSNRVHNIKIPSFEAFPALCNSEIAGPGWTVIQQRIKGGEDFNRDWETYKNGFGDFTGDFFLGLEKIHRLTNNTPHELYIHMEAFEVKNYKRLSFYARYDNFSIAGEDDKYRLLSLGTYSGNAGVDEMRYHEREQFSTFDRDNDALNGRNCAKQYQGGWWYRDCTECNLNGKYYQQEEVDEPDSIWWFEWFSLKTIKMLIRPRGN